MIQVKKIAFNAMAIVVMGLVVVACGNDDLFSEKDALSNANKVLGIDIPANQDWKMTQEVSTEVTVNWGTDQNFTVFVFDKNPFENEDAVYFAKKEISDGSISNFNLSVPSYLDQLYVTVLESDNRSVSKKVDIVGDMATAVFGTAMANSRSMTRSGNPGTDQHATSTGINANANEWADPDKYYGGWIVPDPLTEEQKAVVKAYFQAVPNLKFEDPRLRHFFVQQVYKGATAPGANSTEITTAADRSTYNSDNMNLMTVGKNEQHINNFNRGSYSTDDGKSGVGVLDSACHTNDFDANHHMDQIMLMVNIDDTECFGYHNSGSSIQKNDKAALVDWETIRTWANANGYNGNCLNDGWNRSFLGFDFELYSLEDSYVKNAGNFVYAPLSDIPGNTPQYVWDGKNVIEKGEEGVADLNLTNNFTGLWDGSESIQNNADGTITYKAASWGGLSAWFGCALDFSIYQSIVVEFAEPTPVTTKLYVEIGDQNGKWNGNEKEEIANPGVTSLEMIFANKNMSWALANNIRQVALQADGPADIKIKKIYLKGTEGVPGYGNYFIINDKKVPFLNTNMNMYGGTQLTLSDGEMKVYQDNKECVNLPRFKELVDAGYLPVKDKNLRTWVKWQGGDGYFSDWIVTLTKAKRSGDDEEHQTPPIQNPVIYSYAFEDSWMADYDMNDVVLKVKQNEDNSDEIDVTLCCTGASYNLTVWLGDEKLFSGREVHAVFGGTAGKFINTGTGDKFETYNPVTVKNIKKPAGFTFGTADFWIKSPEKDVHVSTTGQDPHGVLIPIDWRWPKEWTCIKDAYPRFVDFAREPNNPAYADWYKDPVEDKLY